MAVLVFSQGEWRDGEPLKIFSSLERNSLSIPNLPRNQLETNTSSKQYRVGCICALILLLFFCCSFHNQCFPSYKNAVLLIFSYDAVDHGLIYWFGGKHLKSTRTHCWIHSCPTWKKFQQGCQGEKNIIKMLLERIWQVFLTFGMSWGLFLKKRFWCICYLFY